MAFAQESTVQALTERVARLEQIIQTMSNRIAVMQVALQSAPAGSIKLPLTTIAPSAKPEDSGLPKPMISKPAPPKLSESPYRYTKLDSYKSEIRILAIKNDQSFDSPLIARLIPQSLDALPAMDIATRRMPIRTLMMVKQMQIHQIFTALSYTWGDNTQTGAMYIDGKKMKITPSLETALRHMRQLKSAEEPDRRTQLRGTASDESFWWVDAVCINQADIAEKNIQVGQMTRLYKHCHRVCVWLGEATEDSDLAMQVIKDLGYRPRTAEDNQSWRYIRQKDETHRPAGPGQVPVKLPEEPAISEEQRTRNRNALRAFFGRSWFQRVWVRQEIALPPDITIHCGSWSCDWDVLGRAASVIAFMHDRLLIDPLSSGTSPVSDAASIGMPTGIRQMTELIAIRYATGNDQSRYASLGSMLVHARGCRATDARDKVFSVLGLADPSYIPLKPDYGSDEIWAWKQAACQLLPFSLDFLGACQNPDRQGGLPSWIPDLNRPWRHTPLQPSKVPGGRNPDKSFLQACRLSDACPDFSLQEDDNVLEVRGWRIDTVDKFHPLQIASNASRESIERVNQQWYEWFEDPAIRNVGQKDWMSFLKEISADFHKPEVGSIMSATATFEPMLGRTLRQDPAFRTATRLLLSDSIPIPESSIDPAISGLRKVGVGRKLMHTSSGEIGLVPDETKVGDLIVVFQGSTWPHCIRPVSNDEFVLVGEAPIFELSIYPERFRNGDREARFRLI